MKTTLRVLLTVASITAATTYAAAVETYRFENEDGVTVFAPSIPAELAYKGYTVIGVDGTVLRVVPRQLTPAEIIERDKKLAEEAAEKEKGLARARQDQELAKLYGSAADIIEARERKIRGIENNVATLKSNIERLKQQKEIQERQAADRERSGQLPSPKILQNLEILTAQIGDKEKEVEQRQLEILQVREQFQLDLDRFEELFGAPPVVAAEPAK